MQKMECLKHIEIRLPGKLTTTIDKFEGYAKELGKNLVKEATTGKGRYLTILIPVIGEKVYTEPFKEYKKLRYGFAVGFATAKTIGLIGAIIGEPVSSSVYFCSVFGEEFGTILPDFFNYMDARKERKSHENIPKHFDRHQDA